MAFDKRMIRVENDKVESQLNFKEYRIVKNVTFQVISRKGMGAVFV